jgi:hypothetical protein
MVTGSTLSLSHVKMNQRLFLSLALTLE